MFQQIIGVLVVALQFVDCALQAVKEGKIILVHVRNPNMTSDFFLVNYKLVD